MLVRCSSLVARVCVCVSLSLSPFVTHPELLTKRDSVHAIEARLADLSLCHRRASWARKPSWRCGVVWCLSWQSTRTHTQRQKAAAAAATTTLPIEIITIIMINKFALLCDTTSDLELKWEQRERKKRQENKTNSLWSSRFAFFFLSFFLLILELLILLLLFFPFLFPSSPTVLYLSRASKLKEAMYAGLTYLPSLEKAVKVKRRKKKKKRQRYPVSRTGDRWECIRINKYYMCMCVYACGGKVAMSASWSPSFIWETPWCILWKRRRRRRKKRQSQSPGMSWVCMRALASKIARASGRVPTMSWKEDGHTKAKRELCICI